MADLSMGMEAQGMTVHDFFGGNDNRIEANIAQGDWGQNDRGLEEFAAAGIPAPPPIPGVGPVLTPPSPAPQMYNPQQAMPPMPPQPALTPAGHVDATTQSPYLDAAVTPPQPPPMMPQGAPVQMTQEEYLAATGNAQYAPAAAPPPPQVPPQVFGAARTPGEIQRDLELGQMRNDMGELKSMIQTVIANGAGGGNPEAQFASQIGLSEYDADHMLTAGEMTTILGNMAGGLYNETRDMVAAAAPSQQPQVQDPRAAAVTATMVAQTPWLANLDEQAQQIAIAGMLGSGGGNIAPTVPQGGSVQHHIPGAQRPMTFVEHGSSITQQDMGPRPQRQRTMADVIAAKKAVGQHVTTQELAMALRERGLQVPIR
jgi:hypothetical protein